MKMVVQIHMMTQMENKREAHMVDSNGKQKIDIHKSRYTAMCSFLGGGVVKLQEWRNSSKEYH